MQEKSNFICLKPKKYINFAKNILGTSCLRL